MPNLVRSALALLIGLSVIAVLQPILASTLPNRGTEMAPVQSVMECERSCRIDFKLCNRICKDDCIDAGDRKARKECVRACRADCRTVYEACRLACREPGTAEDP